MTDELADRFDASSLEFDPRGNAILSEGISLPAEPELSREGFRSAPVRCAAKSHWIEISPQSDPDRWNVPTARQPQ